MNNKRIHSLICGWLRKQQMQNISTPEGIFIPGLLNIIGLFWWGLNLDWFQTVKCTGPIFINQIDRYILNIDDEDAYFKFTRNIKINNIWQYNFQVQHMDKPICIGICDNCKQFGRNWFNNIQTGYAIAVDGGYNMTFGTVGSVIGNKIKYIPQNILSPCGTEMKINVIINRKHQFVKFIVNGTDLGIAFWIGNSDNSIESFSLAIRISGKDQSIKLVQNTKLYCDNDVLKISKYEAKIMAEQKGICSRNELIDYLQRDLETHSKHIKRKNSDADHLCSGAKS